MSERRGFEEGVRRVSAWPVFVALGLAISEVGIVFGVAPLAVAGLLLFAGSVAGIVHEAGYVESPWPLLAGLAAVLVVVGTALALLTEGRVELRGWSIAAAGALLLVAAGLGRLGRRTDV
jgi:hypothetical protein